MNDLDYDKEIREVRRKLDILKNALAEDAANGNPGSGSAAQRYVEMLYDELVQQAAALDAMRGVRNV